MTCWLLLLCDGEWVELTFLVDANSANNLLIIVRWGRGGIDVLGRRNALVYASVDFSSNLFSGDNAAQSSGGFY